MKLKVNDDGNVEVKEGNPVYVLDDGTEIAFNAPQAKAKIDSLNTESAKHRRAAKEAKEQLAKFGDIDPNKALAALETVANLDDKKLIDANEVQKLKDNLAESFNAERTALKEQITEKDALIHKLAITSRFSGSEFVTKKTFLTPDIAEKAFGDHFKIDVADGKTEVYAEMNGSPVFSREHPGEKAGFEEALQIIINSRPDKDSLLRHQGGSGSGASGGQGNGQHTGENPFKTGNVTAQGELVRTDKALAKQMATEAGKTIRGLNA